MQSVLKAVNAFSESTDYFLDSFTFLHSFNAFFLKKD